MQKAKEDGIQLPECNCERKNQTYDTNQDYYFGDMSEKVKVHNAICPAWRPFKGRFIQLWKNKRLSSASRQHEPLDRDKSPSSALNLHRKVLNIRREMSSSRRRTRSVLGGENQDGHM